MPKLFIPLILGTAREGRQSEKVARLIFAELEKNEEIETQFIDVRGWVKTPVTYAPWMNSPVTKSWQELATRADGFVVVSPEYNHGYPGELKILLDFAYGEYEKKTVAVVGVSSGNFGGVRLIEHLQPIWNYLKMIFVPEPLSFPNIKDVFDENGTLKDESYQERVEKFVKKVVEYTREVKKMRESKSGV